VHTGPNGIPLRGEASLGFERLDAHACITLTQRSLFCFGQGGDELGLFACFSYTWDTAPKVGFIGNQSPTTTLILHVVRHAPCRFW
jgi:hypothetical protein